MEKLKSQLIKTSGWIECSLVDVIGCVTFTLWLPYCNFRCPWCQNSHVVKGINVRTVKAEDIIDRVIEVREFIDYLHVTGGEPTLWSEELKALFHLAKLNGIMVSLDTNGSNPEVVKSLIIEGLIDHVALDLKAPLSNPKKYAEVVGIPLDNFSKREYISRINRTLKLILKELPEVELRIPYIPTLHNNDIVLNTIKEAVRLMNCIRKSHNGVKIVLQQFVPSETVLSDKFKCLQRTPLETLHQVASIAIRRFNLNRIYIRSLEKGVESFQDNDQRYIL